VESMPAINAKLKTQTAELNNLVDKREYGGQTVAKLIKAAEKNLQKTLDRALKKKRGINKYVENKDLIYTFPEIKKAQQAIKNSTPDTYPKSGNTNKRNMFYTQNRRDDQYDDENYQSEATKANNETRRPKSK